MGYIDGFAEYKYNLENQSTVTFSKFELTEDQVGSLPIRVEVHTGGTAIQADIDAHTISSDLRIRVVGQGNSFVNVSDWLRLYNNPTVSGFGRTVEPHPDANKYDWGMKEDEEYINVWAKDYLESRGISVVENIGSKGELTDGYGRYWVAVGPNVMNPAHKPNEGVTIPEMKYGTKLDIVVKDEQETLLYIPAVVGDVKEHTWPDGLYQTGKVFPTGILSVGHDDGSTIEFMGKTREGMIIIDW